MMFISNSIATFFAGDTFRRTLWQARRATFFSKFTGKQSRLKSYESVKPKVTQQKRYLGVMPIPTSSITGTVGRCDDFDGRFRPLKHHLLDRWVRAALMAGGRGWQPIEVLQVGDEYFVIDGHHRASVAHTTGIAFMDARVWHISQAPVPPQPKVTAPPTAVGPKPVPAAPWPNMNSAGCNLSLVICPLSFVPCPLRMTND